MFAQETFYIQTIDVRFLMLDFRAENVVSLNKISIVDLLLFKFKNTISIAPHGLI
ncbi:hypothetical protein GCM10022246_27470 [Pedobacter ginsengiterrae]|uniref:Uncharacterized protein n=1 Tax=Pedobacter ginsengiterrae TaxID=871696 RepID=A0ABP7PYL6_9SPHI